MDQQNVPPTTAPSEPSVWADIAAELHRIADDCMDLVGEPAPAQFELNIQPGRPTVEAVDAVSVALLATVGKNNGTLRRAAGWRGPISFSIYRTIPQQDLDAEIARLREENARLRAAAGLDHARDSGPVDAHGGRVQPHLEDGRNPGQPV